MPHTASSHLGLPTELSPALPHPTCRGPSREEQAQVLKPRRLELGSQLSATLAPPLPHLPNRVPLVHGLEEERGFCVMQIYCSVVGGLGQPLAPQALARAAPPAMSQQQCAANSAYMHVTPHQHGGSLTSRGIGDIESEIAGLMSDTHSTEPSAMRTRGELKWCECS